MSDPSGPRHKKLFLAIASVLAIWGVLGVFDVSKQSSAGYGTNSNVVNDIDPGGPAEAAGLRIGDSLVSIAGVSMSDQGDVPRAEIGQARTFVIQRGGRETTMELTYGPQSGGDALDGYFGILMGVLFLGMGLWAYFKSAHAGTRLLAIVGCLTGPLLLAGPYLAPGVLVNLVAAVAIVCLLISPAGLLDFVLRSGRPNGYEESGGGPSWLYWPAAVMALVFAMLVTVQPAIDGIASTLLQIAFGVFFLFYFGGPLVMVVRNYVKADPSVRAGRGLSLMLAGAIIGLAPLTLLLVLSLLPGDLEIPGLAYAAFGVAAVPITFALAAVKGSGGGASGKSGEEAPAM